MSDANTKRLSVIKKDTEHNSDRISESIDSLSKKLDVANNGYAKGSKIIQDQTLNLLKFQKLTKDKSKTERFIADKLQEIIKTTTSPNATIRDQQGSKQDIKTLQSIAQQDGKVNKELLAVLEEVGRGVKMNASVTKSTGKFIKDQALDAGVTMVAALNDSPLLAAIGSQIKGFMDFRKQKKQEAIDQKNALNIEIMSDNIDTLVQKTDEDEAKEIIDANKQFHTDEENQVKEPLVEIVDTTKDISEHVSGKVSNEQSDKDISEHVSGKVSNEQSDTSDVVEISKPKDEEDSSNMLVEIENNTSKTNESISNLVDIQKDTLDLNERAMIEARENAREQGRKRGKINRGIDFGKEDDFSVLDLLGKNVKDLFQTFASVGSKLSGIILSISKLGVMGNLKILGKIFLKFIAIPMAMYDMISGVMEGWDETEGLSIGDRIIEALQSGIGKVLDTLTFGLFNESSLEKASKWIKDSNVLDGLFKLVDGYIDTYVSIFKFISDKLGMVAKFFGIKTSSKIELPKDDSPVEITQANLYKNQHKKLDNNRDLYNNEKLDKNNRDLYNNNGATSLENNYKEKYSQESSLISPLSKMLLSNKAEEIRHQSLQTQLEVNRVNQPNQDSGDTIITDNSSTAVVTNSNYAPTVSNNGRTTIKRRK